MTIKPSGNPPSEDEIIARKKAFVAALSGEQSMTWNAWAFPIYESSYLTSQGRDYALQAVAILQRYLKPDFPQRAMEARPRHALVSSPFGGFWPANNVPWVYANLFQLAAQLELLHKPCRPLWKTIRGNLKPQAWSHTLLQLEMGGLALQAGWEVTFEPNLGTGKKAGIFLTTATKSILVEAVAQGISVHDREANAFYRLVSWRIFELEWQYESVFGKAERCGMSYPVSHENQLSKQSY